MQNRLFIPIAITGMVATLTSYIAETEDASSVRYPLPFGGARRISYDLKLFSRCWDPKENSEPITDGDWAWGVLDLGRCFANDNGVVHRRYMYDTLIVHCRFTIIILLLPIFRSFARPI